MNDILAIYLKAYTSKKAADSVVDDIAVGTGSGLFGGLVGHAVGKIRGGKLRQAKAPKIERALNRIRARLNELEPQIKSAKNELLRSTNLVDIVKNRGYNTSWIESFVKLDRNYLNKLQQLANKNNQRYFTVLSKTNKLQKAIKSSKRLGGVAGAASASLLGPILYNTLKKD